MILFLPSKPFLSETKQVMVLIALAIILLFGVNKIPQLMKGLGKGIKDFKDEMRDDSKIEDGEEK